MIERARRKHDRSLRSVLLAILFACGALISAARAEEICTFAAPKDISIEKELMITDLSVVNDARADGPDGAWSFGHLMAQLAPAGEASALVKHWLGSWDSATTINGFPLAARPAIRTRLIGPWMKRDGAQAIERWTPNLANAPFRLLAIVYRPDLGIVTKDNAIKSAGEARFVFTALDLTKSADVNRAPPLPFTVIFEYGLAASDRDGVKRWAKRWHALGSLSFGAEYNTRLRTITDSFVRRDIRDPNVLAGSFNQLRTNEGLALPWQLREFRHEAASSRLTLSPLKDTPHKSRVSDANLSAAIGNAPDEDLPQRFLGGAADVPDKNFRWPQMRLANNVLRHNFAVRTCNGCHSAETGNKADDNATEPRQHRGFRHISGRLRNAKATLSEFMTGDPALVMDLSGKLHTFCDLKIRQQALHEALRPAADAQPAVAVPDDLSVARKRRERTD